MSLNTLKRNKKARDFTAFSKAIKTPPAIGTGFTMPGNGRVGISSPTGGVLTVTVGTRVITTPNLAPNQIFRLDWVERGTVIKGLTAGSHLRIFDEWMSSYKITS